MAMVFGIVFHFTYTEAPLEDVLGMVVLAVVVVLVEGIMLWLLASFLKTR